MDVVNQDVSFGNSILADGHDFRMRAVHPNALISILAEDHRLAMLEIKHLVLANAALGEVVERAVIEDVAVLIDLEEGNALVFGGGIYHRAEVFHVDVDRTRDES